MKGREASLRIQERFVSVQGEGLLVGTPSTFVRVAGCNLRCGWCDSPQSSWHPVGERLSVGALVELCGRGPRHVVITGGEPLLFEEVGELSTELRARGHHVTFETAGTIWRPVEADLMSISPKLAHSTPDDARWSARHEARRWRPLVVARLMERPWQLKFVVRAHDDELLRADVDEVEAMLGTLAVAAGDRDRVLLMPQCVDPVRLAQDYARIVGVCTARGFRLGERLHIAIFGHRPGT